LASIFGYRDAAVIGALMSYRPDLVDLFKRGAGYVDKIIKGANLSDLPVQQPTKFELVINMKTAKALGLSIPPTLLARVAHPRAHSWLTFAQRSHQGVFKVSHFHIHPGLVCRQL
jgi:ABC-type uncharacterized transport system substrate-binding protein